MDRRKLVQTIDAVVTHSGKTRVHPYNLKQALQRFERGYIHNILELAGWDLPQTAEMLGISIKTLNAKLDHYHLKQQD